MGGAEQAPLEEVEMCAAEEGSSAEQARCELCERSYHSSEECPLVVAAQQADPEQEAEEAGWQVVPTAARSSKDQADGEKGHKGGKEQGKIEKTGNAALVLTVHRDGANGWVKRESGGSGGSGSKQLGST